jgi:hypothetical protein
VNRVDKTDISEFAFQGSFSPPSQRYEMKSLGNDTAESVPSPPVLQAAPPDLSPKLVLPSVGCIFGQIANAL